MSVIQLTVSWFGEFEQSSPRNNASAQSSDCWQLAQAPSAHGRVERSLRDRERIDAARAVIASGTDPLKNGPRVYRFFGMQVTLDSIQGDQGSLKDIQVPWNRTGHKSALHTCGEPGERQVIQRTNNAADILQHGLVHSPQSAVEESDAGSDTDTDSETETDSEDESR